MLYCTSLSFLFYSQLLFNISKSFGKEFRKRESQTRGIEQDSVNISFQHEELLPLSTIETLSQGVFFGKVADNNDMKIQDKFFCGEIQRDLDELAAKRKKWVSLPRFTRGWCQMPNAPESPVRS